MKLTDLKPFNRADWPYTAVDQQGQFHVFKTRSEKRHWQKEHGLTGESNPLATKRKAGK